MLTKIYLGLLALAVLLAAFFGYYSHSWLGSIGSPQIAAENFRYFSGLNWTYIWISFIALLVFANYLLWKTGKIWTLWSAFGYFALFVVLHTFWLEQSFIEFNRLNDLSEENFSVSPFIGFMTILVVGIGVFFDQFIIKRFSANRRPIEDKTEIQSESET